MRNRTLALASRLFTLFEYWEWRPQHTNPARGIEKAREEPRDRTLSPTELASLGKALTAREDRSPALAAAIRFAVFTGLRVGEVLAVEWDHVDFESCALTLPNTKTGRRTHTLPTPALELLSGLPQFHGCDFVFTVNSRDPIKYETLRLFFLACAADAGLEDVRLHDLRRTIMTRAAMDGASAHLLKDLLGHATLEMATRYVRHAGSAIRDVRERTGSTMAAMLDGRERTEPVPHCREP